MQKGFATLELVIVTMIIVILIGATVPNAVRLLNKVALDFETKRLYTDLRAVQAFDRMTNMRDSHFKTAYDESVRLVVFTDKYTIEKNALDVTYATHYFSNGVTADKTKIIKFDDMGKITPATSDHLTLKLGRDANFYIYFNSVGRFRPSREARDE